MHYVHQTLLLAFGLVLVGCQQTPTPVSIVSPTTATPEEVSRQFVKSISEGDLEGAQRLFISRQEFASQFSAPDIDRSYDELAERFNQSLTGLKTDMQGAEFARMNMSMAGEPVSVPPGKEFGPVTTRENALLLDNVHAVVLIDGDERDLKLDELCKVGDSWRLIDVTTLTPKRALITGEKGTLYRTP